MILNLPRHPSHAAVTRGYQFALIYAMDGLGNEGKGIRSRGWVSVSRESGDAEDLI